MSQGVYTSASSYLLPVEQLLQLGVQQLWSKKGAKVSGHVIHQYPMLRCTKGYLLPSEDTSHLDHLSSTLTALIGMSMFCSRMEMESI